MELSSVMKMIFNMFLLLLVALIFDVEVFGVHHYNNNDAQHDSPLNTLKAHYPNNPAIDNVDPTRDINKQLPRDILKKLEVQKNICDVIFPLQSISEENREDIKYDRKDMKMLYVLMQNDGKEHFSLKNNLMLTVFNMNVKDIEDFIKNDQILQEFSKSPSRFGISTLCMLNNKIYFLLRIANNTHIKALYKKTRINIFEYSKIPHINDLFKYAFHLTHPNKADGTNDYKIYGHIISDYNAELNKLSQFRIKKVIDFEEGKFYVIDQMNRYEKHDIYKDILKKIFKDSESKESAYRYVFFVEKKVHSFCDHNYEGVIYIVNIYEIYNEYYDPYQDIVEMAEKHLENVRCKECDTRRKQYEKNKSNRHNLYFQEETDDLIQQDNEYYIQSNNAQIISLQVGKSQEQNNSKEQNNNFANNRNINNSVNAIIKESNKDDKSKKNEKLIRQEEGCCNNFCNIF